MTVIPTKDMSREQWLDERRKGVGSSDAPIICGLSPWKDPLQLYLEKRGEIEEQDISDKEAVIFGIMLEDIVARRFQEVTGTKVRNDFKIRSHPDHPWMLANLDRTLVGKNGDGPGILECKTSSAFKHGEWGPSETDQVPDYYLVQVNHQLAVTGYKWARLAVLIGGNTFRWYKIPRDEDLIESIVTIESNFWEAVQNGTPPEPNYNNPSVNEFLKALYPGTDGSIVQLDDSISHWHEVIEESKAKVKELSSVINVGKNRILEAMKEASVGLLPDGTGYTRKLTKRKESVIPASEYVALRFSKKPKGAI